MAKPTKKTRAAKPGQWWTCHSDELQSWPGLCPGIASVQAALSSKTLRRAKNVRATIGSQSFVLGRGHWQRGGEPEPTLLVGGVQASRVGNSAAQERAFGERFTRSRNVIIASTQIVPATIAVDAARPEWWSGRHPASGFLHSIADTDATYRLMEDLHGEVAGHIATIDEFIATKPPKDTELEEHQKWTAKKRLHEKWLRKYLKRLKAEVRRLEDDTKLRRERWREYIEPLRPVTFRVDPVEIGLLPPRPIEIKALPVVAHAKLTKLRELRDEFGEEAANLPNVVHKFDQRTLSHHLTKLPRRSKEKLRLQIVLSGVWGYPKDREKQESGYGGPFPPWKFLFQFRGHEGWTDKVRKVVKAATSNKFIKKMELGFDIWNEPNMQEYFAAWTAGMEENEGREAFFETWAHAAAVIKKEAPEALIVGPSLAWYDLPYFEAFLDYLIEHRQRILKAHRIETDYAYALVPDVLSWHEQYKPDAIIGPVIEKNGSARKGRVEELARLLDNKKLLSNHRKAIEFDVNEYLLDGTKDKAEYTPPRQYDWYARPGRTVHFIAGLDFAPLVVKGTTAELPEETRRVRAACHTTTRDRGCFGSNRGTTHLETLDGLWTTPWRKKHTSHEGWKRRSTWYVYKYYAEMRGEFLSLPNENPGIRGIASRHGDHHEVCVLLGRDDDAPRPGDNADRKGADGALLPKPNRASDAQNLPVALHFRNFQEYVGAKPDIEVRRIHIHDIEKDRPLEENSKTGYHVKYVNGAMHTITVHHLGQYDALFIRLRKRKPNRETS